MAKTKVKVTERQKKTLKILEKGLPLYKAMKEAGYSENYSNNPQQIKETQGWNQLMSQDLPESKITQAVRALIENKDIKTTKFPITYKKKEIVDILAKLGYKEGDYLMSQIVEEHFTKSGDAYYIKYWEVMTVALVGNDVARGVDMAIKLRGKYAAEKVEIVDGDIREKSTQELFDEVDKIKADNLIRYDLHEQSSKQRAGNTKKAKGNKKKNANGKT